MKGTSPVTSPRAGVLEPLQVLPGTGFSATTATQIWIPLPSLSAAPLRHHFRAAVGPS